MKQHIKTNANRKTIRLYNKKIECDKIKQKPVRIITYERMSLIKINIK